MELGISMFGDLQENQGVRVPAAQRLREMVEEIKLMDEVGIDFFGLGEHHREEYAVSAPEIVLAAAAGVTNNIRLGSAVSVLSSVDPVRLYQNFATLDGISNGRAEIVVGRGSFIESFPLFGYELNHYDELFEEKLELLLLINQKQNVNWTGKHRPALTGQGIFPRAAQDRLPIWIAVGGTPGSVLRAGRLGLPVIFAIIGGNPAHFQPLFDYYKKVYAHFEHTEPLQTGVHMHAFFGENSKETAEKYYSLYAGQMNRIGKERGWPPYQRQQFDKGRGPDGHLVIGEVNEAVEKILKLKELFGISRFAAHMDVGGPSHKDMMKSIELYGTKIAEKVRSALQ
jgi:probable LLM family oxidoreductase